MVEGRPSPGRSRPCLTPWWNWKSSSVLCDWRAERRRCITASLGDGRLMATQCTSTSTGTASCTPRTAPAAKQSSAVEQCLTTSGSPWRLRGGRPTSTAFPVRTNQIIWHLLISLQRIRSPMRIVSGHRQSRCVAPTDYLLPRRRSGLPLNRSCITRSTLMPFAWTCSPTTRVGI